MVPVTGADWLTVHLLWAVDRTDPRIAFALWITTADDGRRSYRVVDGGTIPAGPRRRDPADAVADLAALFNEARHLPTA